MNYLYDRSRYKLKIPEQVGIKKVKPTINLWLKIIGDIDTVSFLDVFGVWFRPEFKKLANKSLSGLEFLEELDKLVEKCIFITLEAFAA